MIKILASKSQTLISVNTFHEIYDYTAKVGLAMLVVTVASSFMISRVWNIILMPS